MRFNATILLSATLVISSLGVAPAEASVQITVSQDDQDFQVFACESAIEVFAPVSARTSSPISKYERAQIGEFGWELSVYDENSQSQIGPSVATTEGLDSITSIDAISFASSQDAGDVLTLMLEGTLNPGYLDDGSLANYTPETISIQNVTVISDEFDQGDGTEADPFIVEDQQDLAKLRCWHDAYFKLANDIALTGSWLPISMTPEADGYWVGHLDGDGHKITGLNAGHDSMIYSGLFGQVADSSFTNLTIENPTVRGSENVGALFGATLNSQDEDSYVNIDDVHVTNATVYGFENVGLMAGNFASTETDNSAGDIYNSSATGRLQISPALGRSVSFDENAQPVIEIDAPGDAVERVGGMFGEVGEKTEHISNTVDVEINLLAERDYEAIIGNLAVGNFDWVFYLGGYVGNGLSSQLQNISVTADINIEAFDDVFGVGGVSGNGGDYLESVSVSSDIDIVTLGRIEANETSWISSIGGVVGDDYGNRNSRFVNANSDITIELGTGANNSLSKTYATPDLYCAGIGGFAGSILESMSADYAVRVDANITISGCNDVELVGGFMGEARVQGNQFQIFDSIVSGTISVTDADSVDSVAGFLSLIIDEPSTNTLAGSLLAVRAVAAMSLDLPVGASNISPMFYEFSPNPPLAMNSYWDTTLNSTALPSGFQGASATTTQLQDPRFLADAYFDLNNIWQLNGSYPELRTGLYGNRSLAANGDPTVIPAPPAPSAPPSQPIYESPYIGPSNIVLQAEAIAGRVAVATGNRLNAVSGVVVAGIPVDYTVTTAGTLIFVVPKLDPGSHVVLFRAASGEVIVSSLSIVPPSSASESATASPEPNNSSQDAAPDQRGAGKVNVGSLKGKLVIYALGLEGAKLSWKIGGKWQSALVKGNHLNTFVRPVGKPGQEILVEIFVNGDSRLKKRLATL